MKAASLDQGVFHFDSLLGSYRSRTLLNVKEVAAILNRSMDFVELEIAEGKLHAHGVNGRQVERKQVTTASVALYLAETARYEGADYEARLRDLLTALTPAQRRWALELLIQLGASRPA
jgi:hypothetical protein